MRTKKLIIGLLATLAICSCQKDEIKERYFEGKTFTATIDEGTKTSIDEQGNVIWKKGNQVSIFAGSTINQQYKVTDDSEGKTIAGLVPISSDEFFAGVEIDNNVALYPYSSTAEIAKKEGGYLIRDISLPFMQNYAAGSFGDGAFPMVALTASTSDMNLKFKNILGCLKLQLKGTASIASISITGNNNEILCGKANVTVSKGSTPGISLTDESASTVTLNCGDGVALNTSTATPFVIALPPMTMTGGFTVYITDTEGTAMEIKTTKPQTIKRSNILKMPEVNYVGMLIDPFTITSVGNTSVSFVKEGAPGDITLEYKKSHGSWNAYTIGTAFDLANGETLQFRAGEGGNEDFSKDYTNYYRVVATGEGKVKVSGNIMSLLDRASQGTSVPKNGFNLLFKNCSKLVDASGLELPATALSEDCYKSMFSDCTSLTDVPELPATTMVNECYQYMFKGCYSLITAPALPATTLADRCYSGMFAECTALTDAPELLASTLSYACYYDMFYGCTSLVSAPVLPATTLADYCYLRMFYGCTSMTTAPVLRAAALVTGCYNMMFYGCTKLNYVTALFTTTPSDSYTKEWLSCVCSTGTFVKGTDATWDVTGVNGIPSGWTAQTVGKEYVDLGLSVKWATCNIGATKPEEYGDYYAWGETKTKSNYDWGTYKYCNGTGTYMTKYCTQSSYGTVDNKTVLEPDDDVAHEKLGENWRMPTIAEWTELKENCTRTLTTVNGVNGTLMTSKKEGYTDKSIFLPAAGYRFNMGLFDVGSCGNYWSSSLSLSTDSSLALGLDFSSDDVYRCNYDRNVGLSVRPVTE